MTEKPSLLPAVTTVLLLCTPLLLLLSNLYLLATPTFIRYEYSKPNFPPANVYDSAQRLSLAEATLHYLRSNESADYLRNLRSEGRNVYDEREIKHLIDVKVVMRGAFALQAICTVLSVLALVISWRSGQWPSALRAVYRGCLTLLLSLAAIGVLAYANFDLFFVAFHRLFFSGDSWLFSFSDTLIQLFPVQFWIDATWTFASLAIGESIIVGIAAYQLSKRHKEVQ